MRLIDADALRKNAQHAKDISKCDGELLVVGLGHILNAPTIESPRHGWTPCEEGLPEMNEAVLAIIKYAEEDSWYTYALVIRNEEDGSFDMFWGSNEWDKEAYKVIAWQPLPAPYNPDRKEDANDVD